MDSTTVIIGVVLGIMAAIYGMAISFSQKKKFLNEMDIYLTNVENELLETVRNIGLSGLRETPAGRLLFSLLSKKELMILSRDSRASTTLSHASGLAKGNHDTAKEIMILPKDSSDSTTLSHASGLAKDNHDTATEQLKSFLAFLQIPIYGQVEAGPDGVFHNIQDYTFMLVNKVILEGQTFDLHSVSRNEVTDQQIRMTSTRTYGWLRIHGLSMNGWQMPLEKNDYVLFYQASVASHLDYVIVSNREPSGQIAILVKRFDEKNKWLLSNSKDTSQTYDPIPLDKEHEIVGVVIAIAKPAQ